MDSIQPFSLFTGRTQAPEAGCGRGGAAAACAAAPEAAARPRRDWQVWACRICRTAHCTGSQRRCNHCSGQQLCCSHRSHCKWSRGRGGCCQAAAALRAPAAPHHSPQCYLGRYCLRCRPHRSMSGRLPGGRLHCMCMPRPRRWHFQDTKIVWCSSRCVQKCAGGAIGAQNFMLEKSLYISSILCVCIPLAACRRHLCACCKL